MPPKKNKIHLVCQDCGKDFFRHESLVGKFCSRECANNHRMERAVFFCALCDSPFVRRPSEHDYGKTVNQFCSRECYFEWRAERRGPNTYLKIGVRHAHRVIAESILGRQLTEHEIVHHMDENKHNFDPENLAVFPDQSMHYRWHRMGENSGIEIEKYMLLNLAVAA